MKELIIRLLRFVPVIGAICCAANSILSYLYIETEWLGYIMCATFLVAWLAIAKYFRFCVFYILLVLYILACEIMNIIDYIWGIPLSDKGMFVLHCGLLGLTIITSTIAHVRDKRKHKDHIEDVPD